jgi:RNA recognition motif-containing protein
MSSNLNDSTTGSGGLGNSTGSLGSTIGGSPRKGGPKEARLNKVKLMETGRYYEAAIARGEVAGDVDNMFSLRIDNLFWVSEEALREEFGVYGPLGDVYRPINKDVQKPYPFLFVRFFNKADMLNAKKELQGKLIDGRPMQISEAQAAFELETSIY